MLVSAMAGMRNLPAWLQSRIVDTRHNPTPLYDICVAKVKDLYRDNWEETQILPRPIQNDLLTSWLHCEDVSMDPCCFDTWISHISSWDELKPIDAQVFVALMNHPFEVPRFAHEENHVVKRYIHWSQPRSNARYKILCPRCFNAIAKPGKDWSGNWWDEKGWVFHAMVNHSIVPGDMLLYQIWAVEAWCSRCITGTLLDIYSSYECEERTEFHMVEGIIAQFNSGRIHGNYTTDAVYATIPDSDKY